MKKNSYYALLDVLQACGTVVDSWSKACIYSSTHKCILRKFDTEADANLWFDKMRNRVKVDAVFHDAVFFDAGTSRLHAVEARVTDNDGYSVLHTVVNSYFLNDKGNLTLSWDTYSNNFGELIACCLALKYAVTHNKKCIYGDSAITIFFWLSRAHAPNLDVNTINLILQAYQWLILFEAKGGKLMYVSRERNRADLYYLSI